MGPQKLIEEQNFGSSIGDAPTHHHKQLPNPNLGSTTQKCSFHEIGIFFILLFTRNYFSTNYKHCMNDNDYVRCTF
jgi:hypothetical protein